MVYLSMTPLVSVIRAYSDPDGYDSKLPYFATVTVTHLTGEVVYLSGGIGDLNREAYESLLKLLKERGATQIMLERHGEIKTKQLIER